MKLSYLWKGLPGHPLHPPLTDATIGAYTAATVMAFASVIGVAHVSAAHGWWLALVIGLLITALTATTGFLDWITIEWGSPLWWTATWHLLSMVTATVFFLIAALVGHAGYKHGAVETGPFILTLAGFGFLTLGRIPRKRKPKEPRRRLRPSRGALPASTSASPRRRPRRARRP